MRLPIHSRAILALEILLLALAPGLALEFGFAGSVGNYNFPWTQVAPTPGTGPFPATNYVWGGSAYLGLPMGEESTLRLSYELDPILRSVAMAKVEFERGIAKVSVGPFFGLFNSTANPVSVGLSTQVRFQWPGLAYVSVRSDGAMAIGLLADALGAEPQARAEIAAGFYSKNAIISGLVSASSYSETLSGGLVVTDALSSYLLTLDLFKKNVPYTLLASVGYELRSKYFEASGKTEALGSLVLGAKATAEIVPGVRISSNFRSSVFVFGLDSLSGRSPDSNDFFFSVDLGLAFDTKALDKFIKSRGPVEKPEPPAASSESPPSDAPVPPPIEAPTSG